MTLVIKKPPGGKLVMAKTPVSRPIIDTYPAAAAYSLRSLTAGNPPVVRVRRSLDEAEQDFTALQIADGSLASFCSGGAGNGYVSVWYDQSGNGRHATQSTALSQPQIVASGALVQEGSKPALNFNGSQRFNIPTIAFAMNALSVNAVCRASSGSGTLFFFSSPDSNRVYVPFLLASTFYVGYGGSATQFNFGGTGITTRYLWQLNAGASTVNAWRNNIASTSTSSSAASETGSYLSIGSYKQNTALGPYWEGTAQELIFYTSDQSANRVAIASGINSFYGIY